MGLHTEEPFTVLSLYCAESPKTSSIVLRKVFAGSDA